MFRIILTVFIFYLSWLPGMAFTQADSSTKAVELATTQNVQRESRFQRWMNEKPKGLYNNTSFAIISGRGNLFSGIQTSFGYKFNPHLGIGAGIGIERFTNLPTYSYYSANFTLMPVFAEIRYTILKSRFSPVIALQGGYKETINIPSSQADEWTVWEYSPYIWSYYYSFDSYLRGGPFACVELGVNVKIYKRLGLYASMDYSVWSVSGGKSTWRYQHISVEAGDEKIIESFYTENVFAYQHIFLFRLGFTF